MYLSKGGVNVASHKMHEKPKKIQAITVRPVPTSGIVVSVNQKAKNSVPHENGLKGSLGRFEVFMQNLLLFNYQRYNQV